MGIAVALVGAYATYERVLFTATPFLGDGGNFTVGTVGYLGIVNIVSLVGLVVLANCFGCLISAASASAQVCQFDEGWDRTCEYNLHVFESFTDAVTR